jgi:threonine dehydrogenase-like Zn-dependent dehydrogenase
MAKALGADYTFSPDDDEFIATVLEMTDGRGADLTLETVGGSSQTILDQAIEVTRMQGRISILGGFHVPITLDWMKPLLKEHTIYFSSCYSVINGRHDFEMAIDFLSSTLRSLNQIVTHTVSLENIQKGFEIASNKTSGSIKVQILQ